ncbi:MAG: Hpt domain-containing protein [Acidimicrobiia bacterium]|nr:Hpt domain-containing protein [Acidimicrobiia bacterium]
MTGEHELQVLSLETAMELMGGMELFTEIAGMLLAELPELMDEIHLHAADGDLVELSKTAHRIKGNFGVIAAEQAQAAAKDLEYSSRDGDRLAAEAALAELEAAIELVVPELHRLMTEPAA